MGRATAISLGLPSIADDGVIEGHSGDAGGLGELIGVGLEGGEQVGLLVDGVLALDGGVGGTVVGLGGDGLVVELPEVGHGGHHAVVEARERRWRRGRLLRTPLAWAGEVVVVTLVGSAGRSASGAAAM